MDTSAARVAARTGTPSGMIDILGNHIFFEVAGCGPAMLFLHDGILDSAGFEAVFQTFAQRYTVIRYDRPGYGRSQPPTTPYAHGSMLKAILERCDLAEVILIGGSAGGRLALDFAIAFPEHVRALVLIGPAISGLAFSDHMLNRGWRHPWPESVAEWMAFWDGDPWLIAADNSTAHAKFRHLLSISPHNLADFPVERIPEPPALARLHEIQAPTLLLIGEADIADNHAQAGIIQINVPLAERQVVLHTGHLVYLEQPELFNRSVIEFLDRVLPHESP